MGGVQRGGGGQGVEERSRVGGGVGFRSDRLTEKTAIMSARGCLGCEPHPRAGSLRAEWGAGVGLGVFGVGGVKGAGESARCRLPRRGKRQKRQAEAQPAKEAMRGSC